MRACVDLKFARSFERAHAVFEKCALGGQRLSAGTKGLSGNKGGILADEAFRLAALLIGHMRPACSLFAPCDPGASTPRMLPLFPDGP